MKKFFIYFITLFLFLNVNAFSAEKRGVLDKIEGGLDRLFGKEVETKADIKSKKKKKKEIKNSTIQKASKPCKPKKKGSLDKLEAGLDKLFGKKVHTPSDRASDENCYSKNASVKINNNEDSVTFNTSSTSNNNLSLYAGTFDLIDKEGDDQTSLLGIEHKNPNLFRNTFLGKFSPVSGGFVTGNSSVYLYTGVEGQYNIGPIKILPSFAPGYYGKGDGKDLGSALEFKSEIKLGFDIFENSKLGYSYSHISNNDWGKTNPGVDNQQITFSKNF